MQAAIPLLCLANGVLRKPPVQRQAQAPRAAQAQSAIGAQLERPAATAATPAEGARADDRAAPAPASRASDERRELGRGRAAARTAGGRAALPASPAGAAQPAAAAAAIIEGVDVRPASPASGARPVERGSTAARASARPRAPLVRRDVDRPLDVDVSRREHDERMRARRHQRPAGAHAQVPDDQHAERRPARLRDEVSDLKRELRGMREAGTA